MVQEGDSVPEFEVENQEGEIVSSDDIENAVVYFYPKASTPGCTTEACSFRDNIKVLEESGMAVYGVSTDTVEAQKKFHDEQDLNFDLLADKPGDIAEKFGVLKSSGTAERTTFVVRNGKVEKVFRKVSPSEHLDDVLRYLEK